MALRISVHASGISPTYLPAQSHRYSDHDCFSQAPRKQQPDQQVASQNPILDGLLVLELFISLPNQCRDFLYYFIHATTLVFSVRNVKNILSRVLFIFKSPSSGISSSGLHPQASDAIHFSLKLEGYRFRCRQTPKCS